MIARRLVGAAAAAVLALSAVPAASGQTPQRPSLDGADAAILVDARDGTPILEKEATQRRSIASTTKLMTALLTLERAPLDDVYVAADYQAAPAESKIDLRPGERMRVRDLLEALMLESANDAAATLAEGISGSRAAFVAEMNARAAELGLEGTSYANPIGLDDPLNYSTARDLATLARRLLRDRRFARIVDSPSATLESGAQQRTVANRNDLIAAVPAVDGVKTGYTGQAGYVLVGSATGSNGARVVSVVLGEPSEAARDADTLALLRYGLAQYRRVPVLRRGRAVARAEVAYRDETVRLVPRRSVAVTARRDQQIAERVDAPDELEGELAAGTRVGTVVVRRDGEVVRRVALVTAERVAGAGPLRRIAATLGAPLTALALLVIVSVTAVVGMQMRRRRRHRLEATRRRERERARTRDRQDPAGKP
ncbi:MAG TPA: D-alanyl-D-alanine carboxypeptidase family protein [Thermoleophilaceae bacterium]|nr:D-alanyl-D-alanine carboxypeptidase family protein [Thermoleophilaceae bacterium]